MIFLSETALHVLRNTLSGILFSSEVSTFLNEFVLCTTDQTFHVNLTLEMYDNVNIFYVTVYNVDFDAANVLNLNFFFTVSDKYVALCENCILIFEKGKTSSEWLTVSDREIAPITVPSFKELQLSGINDSTLCKLLLMNMKVDGGLLFDRNGQTDLNYFPLNQLQRFNDELTVLGIHVKRNKKLFNLFQNKIAAVTNQRLWRKIIYASVLKISFDLFLQSYFAPDVGTGFHICKRDYEEKVRKNVGIYEKVEKNMSVLLGMLSE